MTRHSAETRYQAIALATSIGPLKAAKQLGLPPTTVSFWMRQPSASPIIAAAEQTIAERLTSTHQKALQAVENALSDPKARLGDKATALRVLGEQAALANGRATANVNVNANTASGAPSLTDHLTWDETAFLRKWIDAVFELRARVRAEHGIGAGELYGVEHHRALAVDDQIIDDAVAIERARIAGLDDDDEFWSEVDDVPVRKRPPTPVVAHEPDRPLVLVMDGPAPSDTAKRVGPPEPPKPVVVERRLVNLRTGEIERR